MDNNPSSASPHPRIAVIGGGITGLSAAYTLQKEARETGTPLEVNLLERSPRLGGKIITDQVDGYTIEGGPDCVLRTKPWAVQLWREIGLENEIIGTNDASRKVFVVNRQKLTPLPDGVMLIIPTRFMPFVTSSLISWPGKIRMGMDLFIPPNRSDEDESVAHFVRRRLGQEALDKIAEPLLGGIHVTDPETQSLLGTFPRFRSLEKNHGSLIRGMLTQKLKRRSQASPAQKSNGNISSMFVTLKGGMEQMVTQLTEHLTGVNILNNTAVRQISKDAGSPLYTIQVENGADLKVDAVILSVPAAVCNSLLSDLNPTVSRLFAEFTTVSTATISLAFRRSEIEHDLQGFGYVSPRKEGRKISACSWVSTKFDHRAPHEGVLIRCFTGGPGRENWVEHDDQDLIRYAREELSEMMGIRAMPSLTRIFRWRNANPQYEIGHLTRMEKINRLNESNPGLFIGGSAFDGVGVPDCVRQGQEAAAKALSFVSSVQPSAETLLQN